MATKPLVKESLLLLNICGFNPNNASKINKIVAAISVTFIIHFITELTLEFALKWKGWESADELGWYFALCLVLSKMVVIMVTGGKIKALLKCITKFWPWNDFDVEFKNEIDQIFILLKRLMMIYGCCPVITLIAYALKPLSGNTRTLPFQTYHPFDYYKSYNYQAMYISQLISFVIAFLAMFGFDFLFISFTTHIVCECKILKHQFLNIKIKDGCRSNLMEVNRLVDHHNLILKYKSSSVKDFYDIYSVQLLNQFLFSLICLCAGLLSIVVSGFHNLHRVLSNVGYIFAFLAQLLIYCAAGACLSDESESVCDAVYQSNWWVKTQPELRKAYTLIIQRAQKGEKLTAGGMFTLNLASFTKILKACMSFFTLAQALYTKSGNK